MVVSCLLRRYRYLRLSIPSILVQKLTSFTGKTYVQDLIDEDKAILEALILHKSAYVYICGDAKSMAKEVEAQLCDILGSARNGTGAVEGRRELKHLSDRRVRKPSSFRQTLTMFRDINSTYGHDRAVQLQPLHTRSIVICGVLMILLFVHLSPYAAGYWSVICKVLFCHQVMVLERSL